MYKLAPALLLAAALIGCASKAPLDPGYLARSAADVTAATRVTDSEFDLNRTYVSPAVTMRDSAEGLKYFDRQTVVLRGFKDKKTGVLTHQVYIEMTYFGQGWRFYNSVSLPGIGARPVTLISRKVDSCSGHACNYREILGIDMTTEALLSDKDGLRLRMNSANGEGDVIALPRQYIEGYLSKAKS